MNPSSSSGSGSGGGRAAVAASSTPTGFIGRYQVLEKIGEGGMGSLYLARDPAIDRLLAIKVLRRGFDSPELRDRFAREARAAGRLRHPNIVTIFDVGEHEGDPFIAMEFLAGETLAELIRHGARLSLARRLKLIEELCDGLAYAHRAGIVHRDIKPANLMVDSEGILKILDFGIVRLDEGGATQSGVLVGTVNYMAPEQVMGTTVDHRSDIFAVGLVAYELLAMRQAFPGAIKDGVFNRILNVAIEPLRSLRPDLDPGIVEIVEQAIRRDPADRYQDLARMRNDLLRARQRVEAAEDLAVEQLAADSGETVIATAPAPTPVPASGTPARSQTPAPSTEAAERALAAGDYRTALTLAGRSAAVSPEDPTVSHIMARAQRALLERGRRLESSASGAPPPSSRAGTTPAPPAAPATASTGVRTLSLRVLALAGVVALAGIGGVVYFLGSRGGGSNGGDARQEERAPAGSDETAAGGTAGTAAVPEADRAADPPPPAPPASDVQTPGPPASPPAGDARATSAGPSAGRRVTVPQRSARDATGRGRAPVPEPAPAAPPAESISTPAPAGPLRVGRDVSPPRRVLYVEPVYPASALGSRSRATVHLDLTIGRDGRVADAQVTGSPGAEFDRAALAAVKRWEFVPVISGGEPVAVVYPVSIDFVPPEPEKAAPPAASASKPQPPAPTGAPAPAPSAASQPSQAPRPPEVRDERAAIEDVLRRYEQAWESRDAEAVARVHALSPAQVAEVRATLANAASYEMAIDVRDISIDPGGRRASVRCSISRRFQPRSGVGRRVTVASVVTLEKRGDAWVITSLAS